MVFGLTQSVIRLLFVYRLPPIGRRGVPFKTFMVEFINLLELFVAQLSGLPVVILGDVNIHYGKAENKDSYDLCDLLHTQPTQLIAACS